MKLNIGNDIIETERIKKLCEKYNEKFKNKVFTNKEIEYCESKGINKYQSYAGRFAAKEAIFKAISSKLNNKYQINWKDIEIINNSSGKPHVNLNNVDFIEDIDISISHVKEYAMATAIVAIK
ncbi:MAG: holo-ACP synthase [Clostridia bacterium]|nr:holo-ACP synthase [Clostridia bacterium]